MKKVLIAKIGIQIKLGIIMEKFESIQRYNFSQNLFYGLRSSQRPSASVGVTHLEKGRSTVFLHKNSRYERSLLMPQ